MLDDRGNQGAAHYIWCRNLSTCSGCYNPDLSQPSTSGSEERGHQLLPSDDPETGRQFEPNEPAPSPPEELCDKRSKSSSVSTKPPWDEDLRLSVSSSTTSVCSVLTSSTQGRSPPRPPTIFVSRKSSLASHPPSRLSPQSDDRQPDWIQSTSHHLASVPKQSSCSKPESTQTTGPQLKNCSVVLRDFKLLINSQYPHSSNTSGDNHYSYHHHDPDTHSDLPDSNRSTHPSSDLGTALEPTIQHNSNASNSTSNSDINRLHSGQTTQIPNRVTTDPIDIPVIVSTSSEQLENDKIIDPLGINSESPGLQTGLPADTDRPTSRNRLWWRASAGFGDPNYPRRATPEAERNDPSVSIKSESDDELQPLIVDFDLPPLRFSPGPSERSQGPATITTSAERHHRASTTANQQHPTLPWLRSPTPDQTAGEFASVNRNRNNNNSNRS